MPATTAHQVFNGALTAENASQLENAAINIRNLLKKTPGDANCLHVLGLIECQLGRIDAAADCMMRSLTARPNSPEVQCHHALVLMQQGKFGEAIIGFKKAAALEPRHVDAHYHLGNALAETGQLAEASAAYQHVLTLKPDHPEALNNLGNIISNYGNPADALPLYRRAVAASPRYAMAYNNMGLAHITLGETETAISHFRSAIALEPGYPDAHNNMGIALRLLGRFEEGQEWYKKALTLRPAYPDALNNMGNVLRDLGDANGAIAHYEKALSIKQNSEHHHNLALALLAAGRFEEGWREHEWRWHSKQLAATRRMFTQPLWQGEAGEGRTLLLHSEQGFGDTLQFCRYAKLAQSRGFRVVLAVQPALVKLLQSLGGADEVVALGNDLPAFDVYCPMMSLPLACGTTVETIPAAMPYLSADAEASASWNRKLSHIHALRVGLVWAGSSRPNSPDLIATDRRRSMAPELLKPLLDVPGVRFFNLQKQGPQAPAEFGLADYMPECHDFADTAALVANLDLVITVDTAVAHLAGALGKPVWVLNRYDACWRWLQNREDSPWYPTMRLFRQHKVGDWEGVVERVRAKLCRTALAWSDE